MTAHSTLPAARGGLLKRTLLYAVGFGLGSLAIAGLLSLVLVTAAEGLLPPHGGQLPTDGEEPAPTATPAAERRAAPKPRTARRARPSSMNPTPPAPRELPL